MKKLAIVCAMVAVLAGSGTSKAQSTGRIECARNDGYVYLYSSITTLDVRATLQCNDVVQITERSENYFGVHSAKGDGYVPLASVVLLRDKVGTGLTAPKSETPSRERIHYDEKKPEPVVIAPAPGSEFVLKKDTAVHVKLLKTVSSTTAHVGDAVDLEVTADVAVDGVVVLAKGAKVSGAVAEAEIKKRFGRGGKVGFTVTKMKLADGEEVKLRCYQEATGLSGASADAVIPLSSGKDVEIAKELEFTALVDGDFPLKREAFLALQNATGSGASSEVVAQPKP